MRYLLITIVYFALITQLNAQVFGDSVLNDTKSINKGFENFESNEFLDVEASYTGDFLYNALGGIKSGFSYMGLGNLKISFDTKEAGLWRGGMLFVNGAVAHGNFASKNLIGDLQVASNIDAGNRIYLHELWYKQSLQHFEFIAGLQDLNSEFIFSNSGSHFINSSFGTPSVISTNMPAPIFPNTTPGVIVRFKSDNIVIQAGAYDGNPTTFEKNEYNTNWQIKEDDGAFLIAEFQYPFLTLEKEGIIKIGYYYHTGLMEFNESTEEKSLVFTQNKGAYIIYDQRIFENGQITLDAFAQIAYSPEQSNSNNYYIGGGLLIAGLLLKENDALGIAFAHAGFKDKSNYETALELFYLIPVTKNISVQPDLQYIINPYGDGIKKNNALAIFFKTAINI